MSFSKRVQIGVSGIALPLAAMVATVLASGGGQRPVPGGARGAGQPRSTSVSQPLAGLGCLGSGAFSVAAYSARDNLAGRVFWYRPAHVVPAVRVRREFSDTELLETLGSNTRRVPIRYDALSWCRIQSWLHLDSPSKIWAVIDSARNAPPKSLGAVTTSSGEVGLRPFTVLFQRVS